MLYGYATVSGIVFSWVCEASEVPPVSSNTTQLGIVDDSVLNYKAMLESYKKIFNPISNSMSFKVFLLFYMHFLD